MVVMMVVVMMVMVMMVMVMMAMVMVVFAVLFCRLWDVLENVDGMNKPVFELVQRGGRKRFGTPIHLDSNTGGTQKTFNQFSHV